MGFFRRFSSTLLFLLFISPSTTTSSSSSDDATCVYTIYIRTGSIIKAGTDSKMSVILGDSSGKGVSVSNLEAWGLMGPDYDYYERGNLDIFSGRGPCLSGPICSLNLSSDGSGAHHGWYCEYLEVTSTGPHKACTQTIFYVRQWLATDAPPYQLTALLNGCDSISGGQSDGGSGRLVVFGKNGQDASQ
ncbi:PLAT domain-containing protein 3-like [Tasmannia lanceolata]|uniref:PLAT domain-containing protein 3-like n=1 Tax=Tasmannia lanceolata TaxID=3420 RepID=UPI004063BA87